jgi:NAD(P)-dependent dehydrogenase (short-subunit alcohol dehydrogenase family)
MQPTEGEQRMTDLRFDGRVAVVTGAAGGLGREYALLLAARGARVLVNDVGTPDPASHESRTAGRAEVVAAEIRSLGGDAIADTTSVATPDGGRAIIAAARDAWGRVDILINNAGNLGTSTRFGKLSDDEFERILGVHLMGSFYVMRAAWSVMVDQGYGRVLNTSSGSVFGEGEERIAYPTAKAAMIGMTRNLGTAGPMYGVKVNALMPIAFTPRLEDVREPLRTWLREKFEPSKVAPLAAFLVHQDVPCSGELFSAGAGRFARVFLGETAGVVADPITLESVRSQFGEVMDAANSTEVGSTLDEIQLYAKDLAGDPPAGDGSHVRDRIHS